VNWEAVIEQVWRFIWRRYLGVVGDKLGGRDRVNCEMHSEIVIERV
jgi:hypothetical protein